MDADRRWNPESPGYRDTRDHPRAWFSPTVGYIVSSMRRQPDEPPVLVRAADRYVVHELPPDAVRLVPEDPAR